MKSDDYYKGLEKGYERKTRRHHHRTPPPSPVRLVQAVRRYRLWMLRGALRLGANRHAHVSMGLRSAQDDGGSEPAAPTVEPAAAKQKNENNNYQNRGGAHG